MHDVTTLLKAAQGGEKDAANKLFGILYQDLRKIAREQLRRQPAAQLDTTALVNESYIKLQSCGILQSKDRRHFLAYAASAMRSAIVDIARSQLAQKRGGDHMLVTLSTVVQNSSAAANDEDIVRIHEALDELATIDERLAKVVELRYFAGLSEEEISETLGVARRTTQRDWEKARLFLLNALQR